MTIDESLDTLRLTLDDDGIAVCTFDRPSVRNALNQTMVTEIRAVLNRLSAESCLKVVVLTGAGERAFISGADIGELRDRTRDDALRRINTQLFREVESFPAPTIAAINGYALGGGLELAMACDLRVCAAHAKLGQPEVGLGILPGAGGLYRLPRLVGVGRARELVFTGRLIDAEEALAIGLVNRIAEGSALQAALALGREIARHSPLAVRFAKLGINAMAEMSTESAALFESTAQALLFDDEEKRRRMTAFLEKKGRRSKSK